jgi:predicted O-methyltransferase YrrM
MRSFAHWTPHYMLCRLREKFYRQTHPREPWLTPEAVRFLSSYLRPQDIGLEFGSGYSTIWFARHLAHLTSIEHNPAWFNRIQAELTKAGVRNVTYLNIPEDLIKEGVPEYVLAADRFAAQSLDFVLVDGRHRDLCVIAVLPILKSGGLLVVDNADVYLPSESITPNARRLSQEAATPLWTKFLETVSDWRCYWTCNGVSASAIYFKPLSS